MISKPGLGRYVLLVEDEPLLRGLIERLLTDLGFVVGAAHDSASGLEMAKDMDPDLAMIDVMLGDGPSGIDLAHSLSLSMPEVALILVTNLAAPALAGLPEPPTNSKWVRKDEIGDPDVLLSVIDAASRGEPLPIEPKRVDTPLNKLTKSQLTVLRLMAQGYSNESIAEQRGSSKSAVEQLIGGIYRSLNIRGDHAVHERAEAIRLYTRHAGPADRSPR